MTRYPIFSAESPEPPAPAIRPAVDPDVLTHVDPQTVEDSFVYVHCYFRNRWQNMLIRIWQSTFLVDKNSGSRSGLLHVENISMAPAWTAIPEGVDYPFLLIFSGLPRTCQRFDLMEEISEPGGFHIPDIRRNDTDVYHIDL